MTRVYENNESDMVPALGDQRAMINALTASVWSQVSRGVSASAHKSDCIGTILPDWPASTSHPTVNRKLFLTRSLTKVWDPSRPTKDRQLQISHSNEHIYFLRLSVITLSSCPLPLPSTKNGHAVVVKGAWMTYLFRSFFSFKERCCTKQHAFRKDIKCLHVNWNAYRSVLHWQRFQQP